MVTYTKIKRPELVIRNKSLKQREAVSFSMKGNKHGRGNKGKIRTEEMKQRQREIKKKNPVKYWLGKKRPDMEGKNNWNWKGGISKLKVYRHYQNTEYINWRKKVFERDNYTCLNCGVSGVFLHPHHIKSYTYYPEYRYDIDNGVTLCVPCHHQLHFGN